MSVWDCDQRVPGCFTDFVRDVCPVLESVWRTSGAAPGDRGLEGPTDRAERRTAVVDDRVARGDGSMRRRTGSCGSATVRGHSGPTRTTWWITCDGWSAS